MIKATTDTTTYSTVGITAGNQATSIDYYITSTQPSASPTGYAILDLTSGDSTIPPRAVLQAFVDFNASPTTYVPNCNSIDLGGLTGEELLIANGNSDSVVAIAYNTIKMYSDPTTPSNSYIELKTIDAGTSVGRTLTLGQNNGLTIFGIGTMAPAYLLELNLDSAGKPGVGGLWTVVCDERIKKDIELADLDRCYDIVKNIPLKYFGWADGVYTEQQVKDQHNLGWIAQDVQKVFPKAVSVKPFTKHLETGDEVIEDCLDLNSGQLIMALYGSVQKLQTKIELLEKRLNDLEQSN